MTTHLPEIIPCIAGGPPLRLYLEFPRVWTQRVGRGFAMYWSSAKRYGRLYPTPTAAELESFYSTGEDYDAYLSGEQPVAQRTRSFLERILQRLAWSQDYGREVSAEFLASHFDVAQADVCDVGCGGGLFLERIRRFVTGKVCGIEPHPLAVRAARERGIQVFQGAAERLPSECAGEAFDLVTMFHSLEHCVDPLLALRNAVFLLRSSGVLVLGVPNHASIGFQLHRQAWFHTDAGRHLFFFTPWFLGELVAGLGCEVIRTEYSGYTRQFGRPWIDSQAHVWDALCQGTVPGKIRGMPGRPTMIDATKLLARTALWSSPDAKYDSFVLIARKRT